MAKKSAGILLYRIDDGALEVLLAHPGGPFWARKDMGAWTIPKGEIAEGEEPLEAARREMAEETGIEAGGPAIPLAPIRMKGGKTVIAFAVLGDCDPASIRSNTFSMEWPPGSGQQQEFPEIDRAQWFAIKEAKGKILPAQIPLLEQLATRLRG
jgi:predicted NUDIX family NTP pyrophosphohydrolase